MKKLLLFLAFMFIPGAAWAQCTGVFPANTICGNLSSSPQQPAAFSSGGTIVGPAASTSSFIPTWANNLGTQLGSFVSISTSQSIVFTGIIAATSAATFTNTTSFNATANFTSQFQISGNRIQFPAGADTVGGLGTNQTWTATNSFSGQTNFSNAPTGAGITQLFTSPATIGSAVPNTGNFSTVTGSLFTANGALCTATVQGYCIANLTSQAVMQLTSTGSLTVQIGTVSAFTLNSVGHYNTRTASVSPAASCTGGAAATGSTDQAGRITLTPASTCNVFFANGYANAPFCVTTPTSFNTAQVATTTTGFTVTFGGNTPAFQYICQGL